MPYEILSPADNQPTGRYEILPPDQGPATAGDRAQAAASGVNRGALVNLLGLPVSTALNAWDLAKAGAGVAYHETTGKPVPDALTPADRSQYMGSPEWIARQIEQAGGGAVIDPRRPDDATSRVLHAGGQGASMAVAAPQSIPSALVNGTLGALSTAGGQVAAENGASPATQIAVTAAVPVAATMAATRAQNVASAATQRASQQQTLRDTINDTRDAGYVYPLSQTNPTPVNKAITGLGGKAATEQSMSVKNQSLTDSLAARQLGLPPDVALSRDVLERVRNDAVTAGYDPVKQFGTMGVDPQYRQAVQGLLADYRSGTGGFQSLRSTGVENLLAEAQGAVQFSSESAINMIRRLREQATDNFRAGGDNATQLARAQRGVADSLENLVGRELQRSGQTDLLSGFQAARKQIAQSFNVEDALNPATGSVDARRLFRAWDNGAPLSGDLLTIARFGGAGKNVAQQVGTPPGISVLDYVTALGPAGIGIAAGHPATAASLAWPAARIGARALSASAPAQRFMGAPPDGASLIAQMLSQGDLAPEAIPLLAAQAGDATRGRSLADLANPSRKAAMLGLLRQGQ